MCNIGSKASIAAFLLSTIVGAMAADRSPKHAVELSYQYGDYTKGGNLKEGQMVTIQTPEGSITCTSGSGRKYTGKNGPQGAVSGALGSRRCRFN